MRDEDNAALEKWYQDEVAEIEDDIEHPDKIPEKIEEEIEQIDDTIEKDEEVVKDIVNKQLPYQAKRIWYWTIGARWVLNAITVALPTTFFLVVLNLLDLLFNAVYNKLWAHGNFFLILNWLFMISQTLLSIPILFEIQTLLKILRPIRILSLLASFLYNFLWLGAISDLFWLYFGEKKTDFDEDQGFMDVFLQLFLSYSIIACIPNIIINTILIFKEFSFPILQLMFNRKAPTDADRLQLGLIDLEYLFVRYLNPGWWFQQAFEDVEGYDPVDMVIENKNDE